MFKNPQARAAHNSVCLMCFVEAGRHRQECLRHKI
jgi:hypothetical protein